RSGHWHAYVRRFGAAEGAAEGVRVYCRQRHGDGEGAVAAGDNLIVMDNVKKRAPKSTEHARLEDSSPDTPGNWKAIGPYLSERAWGTVREDYSADGEAWQYFPYEHARARQGITCYWLNQVVRRFVLLVSSARDCKYGPVSSSSVQRHA